MIHCYVQTVDVREITETLQANLLISKEEADKVAVALLDRFDIHEATSSGIPLDRHVEWIGAETPLRRSRPAK